LPRRTSTKSGDRRLQAILPNFAQGSDYGSNNRAFELVSIVMRERIWKIGECVFNLSRRGLIMGVLNVTPDSFSDGGKFLALEKAVEHGLRMAAEGADIIDLGGESTRPGAEPVTAKEELRRAIPAIKKLRPKIDIPISIDTSKASVARAAIEAGASIINDVTGGCGDAEMLPLIAGTKSALIIMHMQGNPQTMQIGPQYADVIVEVADFFRQQYARAIECGSDPMAIAFDPGIGFGKTLDHNLELLAQLEKIRVHDRPLVVGVSRKGFLAKLTGAFEMEARLAPTLALNSLLRARGADVFRVHDVRENVGALRVTEAILRKTT
jgi:dihydropteroate synthase